MNNRFWELGPFREPPEERSRAGRARKLARLKVDGSSRGSGIGSTATMLELKTGRATKTAEESTAHPASDTCPAAIRADSPGLPDPPEVRHLRSQM